MSAITDRRAVAAYLETKLEAEGRKPEHFAPDVLASITTRASSCLDDWGALSLEALAEQLETEGVIWASEKAVFAIWALLETGEAEVQDNVVVSTRRPVGTA